VLGPGGRLALERVLIEHDAVGVDWTQERFDGTAENRLSDLRSLTRHELVEGIREAVEVRKLPGRRGLVPLAEPIDPDRRDAELVCRSDVVEVALGHVNVAVALGAGGLVEGPPMAVRRFVRTDL
jgi:hypothetical protein